MEENTAINSPSIKRADAQQWLKFLEVLTLSLGAGLFLCGLIFFFAFNWEYLHRFTKMGTVLVLLMATFGALVKAPMRDWVRNITIFAMCVLVGAFLAVMGQVYQTGADSYLLFLSWAICIVAWVVVADFYPLWLFFIGLVMLTYGLVPTIKQEFVDFAIFLAIFTAFFEFSPRFIPNKSVAPRWFMTLLFGVLCIFATILISICIFKFSNMLDFVVGIGLSAWMCFYAIKNKNLMVYSLFCSGILIEVYELFIRLTIDFHEYIMIIIITLPFMALVYFLGKHLIEKKKMWESAAVTKVMPTDNKNENEQH